MPGSRQWLLLFVLLCFATLTVWVRELWAVSLFYAGVFVLFASRVGGMHPSTWLLFVPLPLTGVIQLVAGRTVVPSATVEAVLHWGALGAVFALARHVCAEAEDRHRFLSATAGFGIGMAALCLLQMETSGGKFLWHFETGYPERIFGSFGSRNNWAHFMEVMIAVCLWKTVQDPPRAALFVISSGLMYGSVIASASRAGSFACTAVMVAVLGVLAVKHAALRKTALLTLAGAPVAAALFTYAAGWETVALRLQEQEMYKERWSFVLSSLELIRERPLLGWGLGTWPIVYPHKALQDDSTFINRAHNDWVEYGSDAGLLFLAALAIPFLRALPWMVRHPWSLGLAAVLAHAWVDYPFPRPGVSGWMFAILGMLYAAENSKFKDGDRPALPNLP